MGIEIDFTHGEHGALIRTSDLNHGIVFAYLPQHARIGLYEALAIEAEYDAVKTHDNCAPLSADRVQVILACRCGKI
jgi:hypothetical protein